MSTLTVKSPADATAQHNQLRLIVSIPALNEELTIGEVIAAVPRDVPGIQEIEVVVVDDGSTDRTASVAAAVGARVIAHDQSKGVGAAFRTALTYAIEQGVDVVVTIDGDGQFDPTDITKLIKPIVDYQADFVTASRFIDPKLTPRMPFIKRWGNRQLSRLISQLTGKRFHDVSCGMRCYNRRAMLSLNLLGDFTYTQEVFLNLAFKGLKITEVPISVAGQREHGESRVAGSIWRYAVCAARIIIRAYRDYKPMRFFGAIAAALFVPALLLGSFLLIHFYRTGSFSPHKWAGFTAAVLVGLSLIMLHIGMIGDMLNRHRIYLEELLFYTRMSGGKPPRGHSELEAEEDAKR